MGLAQTNLQLFRQARDAGYSDADILVLRRDYETACLLHGAYMRPSGKPFLCHLVGTASALIIEKQAMPLVRAALNHAAYDVGRFPTGARGIRSDHSRWLKARVGDEVEQLIRAYETYEYSPETVRDLAAQPDRAPSGQARDLLIIKLCNDVDDSLDYSPAIESRHRWFDASYFENLKKLSRQLGLEYCIDAFDRVALELADADWLAPNEKMAFQAHRQSIPRYGKSTIIAWAKSIWRRG